MLSNRKSNFTYLLHGLISSVYFWFTEILLMVYRLCVCPFILWCWVRLMNSVIINLQKVMLSLAY